MNVGGVDGDDGRMIYYYNCDYYSQANHRVTEPKVSPSRWRGEAEEARWIVKKNEKKKNQLTRQEIRKKEKIN